MFKGSVSLLADIQGNGLSFPAIDFDPRAPGVEKVTVEGPDGQGITFQVHFASVPTVDEAKAIASPAATPVLNRIAYHRGVAVADARITGDQFTPLAPTSSGELHRIYMGGTITLSGCLSCVVTTTGEWVKATLEEPPLPGERFFGLFRDALRSSSPVEVYMHLYNLLLMLYDDKQPKVDSFIRAQNPTVPQTPRPDKPRVLETVYSRLRNEFAHTRAGVNLADTKAAMENRVGELRDLTRKAIELNP